MGGLIVASEALASGDVTRQELRKYYVKVFHNVHLRRGVELTAAFLWSGRKAVVSGVSAAALHGNQWISAERPAELVRARHDSPPGIISHHDRLLPCEQMTVRGIPVTTPARTVFDVGRRVRLNRAVELTDVLLGLCTADSVMRIAE
ncbi:cullin, a subunit of E3 ubiquitin ligase [Mycobacteroides abscessus subsp. abscessus]|nr:cullin, a subunit of E3 ubiquitin ligase [Mycobacteroides abscessus subsp. abscessus]